ncbi:MAG: universal stress protein, partial [Solirubrobacterales bacterium]
MYERILVAFDDSPGARAALDRARAIADSQGGKLTLVRSATKSFGEAADPKTIASG